jgi:two-component system, chemotaxis family, sensor kinase CheA
MTMDAALQIFLEESQELLIEMESGLLECARNTGTPEVINSVFRAAHTIKGSSGLFGLDAIVSFVHVMETALDRVRVGEVPMDAEFAMLLLSCKDHVEALVASITSGQDRDQAALESRSVELSMLLQARAGTVNAVAGKTSVAAGGTAPASVARASGTALTDSWHISARFKADVLRSGMDPLSFIRYLGTIGQIRGVRIVSDALPSLSEFDPETCYVGFELSFSSDADEARIRAAFEFVSEDCVLHVLPPRSAPIAYLQALPEFASDPALAADILISCGSLTREEVDRALGAGAAAPMPPIQAQIGVAVSLPAPAARPSGAPAEPEKRTSAVERSIRVDAAKLDHLINLVGELIIAAAGANVEARRLKDIDLQEATSRLTDLVEGVRDSTLQLRMVKIGATFSRFQRVVNDVARELGKDIELVVSGEDTELDKTVVERITDPLTHLVRNAIDHGIESGALRAERGKDQRGKITLNAYHDSGSIVIEVGDDGGGLKRERILAKAVERGLIEPGKALSEQEIYALIFEPGFSTAEQVTNLSGRGVGMDVVKRNITALRGDIEIRSVEGRGTTVSVRLPLTLAIINGFQVGVGKSVFVVPLDMVEECIEFLPEPGHDYANVRGQALPLVRLRELFGLPGAPASRESIVIVRHGGIRAGLVVDALLGEYQTVIKPLAKMFSRVKCISGSSILGNGEVALIIDVALLVQHVLAAASGATQPLLRAS